MLFLHSLDGDKDWFGPTFRKYADNDVSRYVSIQDGFYVIIEAASIENVSNSYLQVLGEVRSIRSRELVARVMADYGGNVKDMVDSTKEHLRKILSSNPYVSGVSMEDALKRGKWSRKNQSGGVYRSQREDGLINQLSLGSEGSNLVVNSAVLLTDNINCRTTVPLKFAQYRKMPLGSLIGEEIVRQQVAMNQGSLYDPESVSFIFSNHSFQA